MRVLLLIALLGTSLPVQAMAQHEIQVLEGSPLPPVRACVDYVGRGTLKITGVTVPQDQPDGLNDDGLYRFRFEERGELVGHSPWVTKNLFYMAHALARFTDRDSVVFLAKVRDQYRFLGWARVWRDREGRAFIPIYQWPEPASRDWEPQAIRRFAKPVDYRDGPKLDRDNEVPGLIETRDGRTRILNGLYLTDIPAMFEAAKSEPCWR